MRALHHSWLETRVSFTDPQAMMCPRSCGRRGYLGQGNAEVAATPDPVTDAQARFGPGSSQDLPSLLPAVLSHVPVAFPRSSTWR